MADIGRATSQLSQLHWAAETARLAPSIFNTQPWRWQVGEHSLELWADRTRQLGVVDPSGRLLIMSCGVALHHAYTALVAGGDEVVVERMPDPDRPDLLARLRAPRPGGTAGEQAQARFAAISHRHTDRRAFGPQPVPEPVVARLRDAAEEQGAHLHILDHEDVSVLAAAASQAAEVELADPLYRAELRAWTERPRWGGDGVPIGPGTPSGFAHRVPLREFAPDEEPGRERGSGRGEDPAEVAAGTVYAVLWGIDDEPRSWLRAGEALSAVMLDATAAGLGVSPMSDVVEVEASRQLLRDLLARLGHPYLAIRFGYPPEERVSGTPRRRTADMIEPMPAPPPADGSA